MRRSVIDDLFQTLPQSVLIYLQSQRGHSGSASKYSHVLNEIEVFVKKVFRIDDLNGQFLMPVLVKVSVFVILMILIYRISVRWS